MERKNNKKYFKDFVIDGELNQNLPKTFISRRKIFKLFGLLGTIVAVVLLGTIVAVGIDPVMLRRPAEAAGPLEQVIFRTTWVPGGKEAAFWLAKEKGFWSKNGIDVVLRGGIGSSSNAQLIGSGRDDFGIVDASVLINSRLEGIPIKMVGLNFAKHPIILISKKEKNILKPKDVEGKTVITGTGTELFLLQAFLKFHKVDLSKVKTIVGGRDYSMLMLQDKVDATTEQGPTILPTFKSLGFEEGKNLNIMKFSELGFSKLLGNGICMSESMITKRKDLVKRFVPSFYEGIRYAMGHPDETAEIFVKYFPEMDKKVALEGLKMSFELHNTVEARENTLGWMSKEQWNWTQDLLFDLGQIKSKIPVEDLFTNEFLSGPPFRP